MLFCWAAAYPQYSPIQYSGENIFLAFSPFVIYHTVLVGLLSDDWFLVSIGDYFADVIDICQWMANHLLWGNVTSDWLTQLGNNCLCLRGWSHTATLHWPLFLAVVCAILTNTMVPARPLMTPGHPCYPALDQWSLVSTLLIATRYIAIRQVAIQLYSY